MYAATILRYMSDMRVIVWSLLSAYSDLVPYKVGE